MQRAVAAQACKHLNRLAWAAPRALHSSARRQDKDYYVTTPIFYVNAQPHIGHLHSQLLADVLIRFNRLKKPNTRSVLCTGTDEHGLKIQRVAEAKKVSPRALCDEVSETFRSLARSANVDCDIFIRTTEERHKTAVEHVWTELDKRGFIYKDSYAGWYAVSDEAYYTASQVHEVTNAAGETEMVAIESGTKVEWMQEDTYKFRLSGFKDKLIAWLKESKALQPPSRTAALLAQLQDPNSSDLNDLSISRPSERLDWGIRVPGDPDHTIYVWIDALINYLTAAGYPWTQDQPNRMWPPDVQVVGKDIIRFHALYLPAVLMALELPLPKVLLAHGHWTMDKMKMSKSRGNVADPIAAMKLWGVDPIRAYLMRAGGNAASDADYAPSEIDRFYRKELAGQVGNLLSRITAPKLLKRLGDERKLTERPETFGDEGGRLAQTLDRLRDDVDEAMSSFAPQKALSAIFQAVADANAFLQNAAPWLASTKDEQVHESMFLTFETLRIGAILLQPFMPTASTELLNRLGIAPSARSIDLASLGLGQSNGLKRGPVLFPPVETA